MKCVIPCAGVSSRMSYVPKTLIKVGDKSVLSYVIDSWRDAVDGFIFVVRRRDIYYWEHLPENSAVVFQDEPKGLADAILKAESYVNGRFIVALGDCLHKGIFEIADGQADLGVGVWQTNDAKETRKSYLVSVAGDLVRKVIEKPKTLRNPPYNCGMGTYFLDMRVFEYIRKLGGDFTAILQAMIDDGNAISPIWFNGEYINVGSPEDIAKAERIMGWAK